MRVAAFTVDVDRDVNLPVKGKKQALSKCHDGDREETRFDSSRRGLQLLIRMLEELGIEATFFFEGDTLLHISEAENVRKLLAGHEAACHGVCHEDITGESTSAPLTDQELGQMIDDGHDIVKKAFDRDPVGFRAPYQHIDSRALRLLQHKGFLYDSSMTKAVGSKGVIRPWKVAGDMMEMPLAQGNDAHGKKMVSYLWPMHEGRRVPEDYIGMAERMRSGVLVLATHSWHMVETYGKGMLSKDEIKYNLDALCQVLDGAKTQGWEFLKLEEIARTWKG
jgi:peptidoglycan/xylan/chitin deacetylase (PgdA/CDA1 family)